MSGSIRGRRARPRHRVRPNDRAATVAGLLLSILGLGLLLVLPGILPGGGSPLWSVLWLTAVAALLAGVLIVAPIVRGVFLVSLVLLGVTLAGISLVHVGTDALTREQEEAVRDTAALLRYRVAELPASGVEVATPLVEKLCESAGGELPGAPPWVCERQTNADAAAAVTWWRQPREAVRELITVWRHPRERPPSVRELAIARAGTELFVAEQELAAATGTTEVESRRLAAETARAALQTTDVERTELAEAVTAGASSVLDGLLSAEGRIPLAIGVAGWFALAAFGLATLRWAATRNSTRGLGPVSLDEVEKEDEVWGRCKEQFRTHLLENVPEPGTVPHADALIQVANLVGAVVPPASGAAKTLAAMQKTVLVERGYAVQVAILRPAKGEGNTATAAGLVVRVRKARTRTMLAQREFRFDGSDESLMVREAAYWAAGVVIEDSRSVPLWARWSQDAVGPLARSEAARSGATAEGQGRELPELEEAAKRSPASGLLLLKLAHARELEPNLAGAFAYALEAASLYPRHLDARYRLATEASMLAEQLRAADAADLERCRLAARRYLGDRHLLSTAMAAYRDDEKTEDALQETLLRFALQERRRTRWWVLSPFALAWHALHASERDLWLSLLLHRRLRTDRQRRLTTAQLVTHQQLARHRPLRPVVRLRVRWQHRLARRGDAVWQQPYNLACFHARAGQYARLRPDELDRDRKELEERSRLKQRPRERWRVERQLRRVQRELETVSERSEEVRDQHVELARMMLECARVARGSEQLTQRWLEEDPDLDPLREELWWDPFVTSCRALNPDSNEPQRTTATEAASRTVRRSAGSTVREVRPKHSRRSSRKRTRA
jgi:hypothetical protein